MSIVDIEGDAPKGSCHVFANPRFGFILEYRNQQKAAKKLLLMQAGWQSTANRTDRITLGTNLYIDKKYTKLQINYQINGEESKSTDNNEWLANLQVAF